MKIAKNRIKTWPPQRSLSYCKYQCHSFGTHFITDLSSLSTSTEISKYCKAFFTFFTVPKAWHWGVGIRRPTSVGIKIPTSHSVRVGWDATLIKGDSPTRFSTSSFIRETGGQKSLWTVPLRYFCKYGF